MVVVVAVMVVTAMCGREASHCAMSSVPACVSARLSGLARSVGAMPSDDCQRPNAAVFRIIFPS